MLNTKQQDALNLIKSGESVFLTGPAGCGKTYIVKQIKTELPHKNIAITSSTGVSAVNIGLGSSTLHSWLGIDTYSEQMSIPQIVRGVKKRQRVGPIRDCQLLVIDEISMTSSTLFDIICQVLQEVRGVPSHPTGGLQIVASGDFLQLKPVKGSLAFKSALWKQIFPPSRVVYLTEPMRQKDTTFYKILMDIRTGNPSEETIEVLRGRIGAKLGPGSTKIVSRNEVADRINEMYLRACINANPNARIYTYRAQIYGPNKDTMASLVIAPTKLEVIVGISVMLLANIDIPEGLCNGASGRIVDFTDNGLPIVHFLNGAKRAIHYHKWDYKTNAGTTTFTQVPLKLLYGTNFHKTQGMTIDKAVIDIGRDIFTEGQVYVGLGRVRRLEDLSLVALDPQKIKANADAVAYYESLAC